MIKRIIFLIILALPFFVALDESSVWDANEAFYVQTPREMIQRGDWLVPYFNGQPRLNKPPLSYWLVAPLYRLFGVSLFWERLLLAVLGFGAVLLVYRIGKRLYEDDGVALLAAGILATTFRYLMLSRRLLIDILLLFWLLGFLSFYLDWRKSGKTGRLIGAAVCLGLAFLSKGPVALLAALVPALLLLLDRRGPRPALRQLIAPAAVFLAIASSWYVALGLRLGWGPVVDFFLRENLGRFANLEYGPARGPFYYLGVFLGDFFPWSIFFVAALAVMLFRRSWRWRDEAPLLVWIGVFLVFFSLSRNKQEYYILPVYPVAALWMAERLRRSAPPRWVGVLAGVLTLIAAASLYWFATRIFPSSPTLSPTLWAPLGFALAAAIAFGYRYLREAALALALAYSTAFVCYLQPFEAYKPVAAFAQTIRIQTLSVFESADYEAGYFNFTAPSLAFYLNRPIFETYSLDEALERLRSDKLVFMVVRAEDYPALAAALGRSPQIVDARPKLYTTARLFLEGFKCGRNRINPWARPVYLISNEGIRRPRRVVDHNPGL